MLSVLEHIDVQIAHAVGVAGFVTSLPNVDADSMHILQSMYDWDCIRTHASWFTFIHSDNDPWGCGDDQGRLLFQHLGGTLVIRHGEGHMGSHRFSQPYTEFPFLMRLV